MAVAGNNVYPSIQTVLDLVRSLVLDDMAGATSTVGEGQIYVDNMAVSVTLSNFFNSALREFCRELRIIGGPMLIRDNYLLLGLPPVNSSLGLAVPNPAVQCYVNGTGYFDGTAMHPTLLLPADFVTPIAVWERLNASNGAFQPMTQAVGALAGVNQVQRLGEFEWRGEALWMHGATTVRDMRLRYFGKLVNLYAKGVDVTQCYIPINGCEEALADKIVRSIARRMSPERLADAVTAAAASLYAFRNEQVKQKQGLEYQPQAFGSEAGPQLGY
jgi:hypothetical protein